MHISSITESIELNEPVACYSIEHLQKIKHKVCTVYKQMQNAHPPPKNNNKNNTDCNCNGIFPQPSKNTVHCTHIDSDIDNDKYMGIIKSWNLFLCAYNGGQSTRPMVRPIIQIPAQSSWPPPGDAFHLTIRKILCAQPKKQEKLRSGHRICNASTNTSNNNNNCYKPKQTIVGTRFEKFELKPEPCRRRMTFFIVSNALTEMSAANFRILPIFDSYLRSHSEIILIENLGVKLGSLTDL